MHIEHIIVPVTCCKYCCRTYACGFSTTERKANCVRVESTLPREKSLEHKLEEQDKLELPKQPFENKAETSYLAKR